MCLFHGLALSDPGPPVIHSYTTVEIAPNMRAYGAPDTEDGPPQEFNSPCGTILLVLRAEHLEEISLSATSPKATLTVKLQRVQRVSSKVISTSQIVRNRAGGTLRHVHGLTEGCPNRVQRRRSCESRDSTTRYRLPPVGGGISEIGGGNSKRLETGSIRENLTVEAVDFVRIIVSLGSLNIVKVRPGRGPGHWPPYRRGDIVQNAARRADRFIFQKKNCA